jgi:hypothetical protein
MRNDGRTRTVRGLPAPNPRGLDGAVVVVSVVSAMTNPGIPSL